MKIIDNLKKVEPKSMHHVLPIEWKYAKNDIITDTNDKKYIDFTSTIFVMNVGHSNVHVKNSIKKAIDNNLLHTYTFSHTLREQFLTKLINNTPDFCEKAFMLSSGTEATEASIRLMRMYTNRKKIISFKGCMHGRTMGADLMKGTGFYEHEDFIKLPFPCSDETRFKHDYIQLNIDPKTVAGIMIESYQGWSARFLPKEYIKDLCTFAKEHGICVCFDEVQAGFWRTGKQFGFQHYDVTPDLICIGKAIGGGLPLSGVLGRKEILDIPEVGDMSSTHSANPLCCASGLAVLEVFDKIINQELIDKETEFKRRINIIGENDLICEVNCNGLLSGIIFKDEKTATDICKSCLNEGVLLVHTGRESIKLGPPLTITIENLNKGLNILERNINDYKN